MIVEVQTVGFGTEPSDYIDEYEIHEAVVQYEANDREYEEECLYVKTDRLDALIDHIGTSCIVHDSGGLRAMDDSEWIVRVYDGYNE